MPDDDDYEWLGWLIAHPDRWSNQDLSTVRSMIVNQTQAMKGLHPRDGQGRRSAQQVIDDLEAAVETYLSRPT